MSETRMWTVTSCEEFRSGVAKTGRPWTLYVLSATDDAGLPVMEGIKSFDAIPLGMQELEVEQNEYKGETEWTVKLKNGQQAMRTPDQGNLAAKLQDLENRIDRLERVTGALSDVPPVPKTPAAPPVVEDDPIPF
jgi:hypothetical protein